MKTNQLNNTVMKTIKTKKTVQRTISESEARILMQLHREQLKQARE